MPTKTSISSPLMINQVVPPSATTATDKGAGWVAITLAPGKKTQGANNYWDRDLDADLDRLVELGTTSLVPLLEDDELVRLKIPTLVESAKQRGLSVQRFPYHDGGIPEDIQETVEFVQGICKRFEAGEHIVMHCNGGLGRAGTMAACVRLALGLDISPEQAIASVRKARGPRAIENSVQENFVACFMETLERAFGGIQVFGGATCLDVSAAPAIPIHPTLTVSRSELIEALKPLRKLANKKESGDCILSFDAGKLAIQLTGVITQVEAQGTWPGQARIGGKPLAKLWKTLPPGDPVDLSVHDDRLHMGTLSLGCVWQSKDAALIHLPIDAPLPVILSAALKHTPEEITASGLGGVVEQAEKKRDKIYARALKILETLDISHEDLSRFVDEHIRRGGLPDAEV